MSDPHHDVEPQSLVAATSKRKFEELVVDPHHHPLEANDNGGNPAVVDTTAAAAAAAAAVASSDNHPPHNSHHHHHHHRWYPSSIVIDARTFDGTSVHADLMTVIGRGVKANKCTLSERYYLPSHYNQNNAEYRAKTIAPIFASACASAGCEVRLKGWEKSKGFLKFVCPQYRRYKSAKQQAQQATSTTIAAQQPQDTAAVEGVEAMNSVVDNVVVEPSDMMVPHSSHSNKKNKLQRTISRPLDKESTCPFSFLVFWEEYAGQDNVLVDRRKGRWFVCATGAGTPYHEGHARKEFSEGELRRKQLLVEGAFDILMPFYKKVVDLVDRDEDKLNQAIGRFTGLIDGLKRQTNTSSSSSSTTAAATAGQAAAPPPPPQEGLPPFSPQAPPPLVPPTRQRSDVPFPTSPEPLPAQVPLHSEPPPPEAQDDVADHHHHDMKLDSPPVSVEHLNPHPHPDDGGDNSPATEAANALLEQQAASALLDQAIVL